MPFSGSKRGRLVRVCVLRVSSSSGFFNNLGFLSFRVHGAWSFRFIRISGLKVFRGLAC